MLAGFGFSVNPVTKLKLVKRTSHARRNTNVLNLGIKNVAKKKYNETEEFKALQKQWDERLKNSGFQDIELKENLERESETIVRPQQFSGDNSVDYYQLCEDTLANFNFR